ncbi:MAG: helix-turn-helix domain-containing protein [Dehalococcoidia bacterium]|nr:helix-turn-helix domain-containing protein [Dehalococcoidia bacterium]
MSTGEKAAVLDRVESGPGRKRQVLSELDIPKSTYYRWRQRQRNRGLEGQAEVSGIPWNRLMPEEESTILVAARESPELSSRYLAVWLTDHGDFAVSPSTVYRILKREGLVKQPEIRMLAEKE